MCWCNAAASWACAEAPKRGDACSPVAPQNTSQLAVQLANVLIPPRLQAFAPPHVLHILPCLWLLGCWLLAGSRNTTCQRRGWPCRPRCTLSPHDRVQVRGTSQAAGGGLCLRRWLLR